MTDGSFRMTVGIFCCRATLRQAAGRCRLLLVPMVLFSAGIFLFITDYYFFCQVFFLFEATYAAVEPL